MNLRSLIAVLGTIVMVLAAPALASAHATLESSVPERGAELEQAPDAIELQFSEPVEASFGSVRLFDSSGDPVEGTENFRPGGEGSALGIRLPDGLGEGAYTATYRVISADSHPVSGGFVFTVGDPGAAPTESVSELLDDSEADGATRVAAGVARFFTYAATALAVGVFVFALFVFGPAIRQASASGDRWREAAEAFDQRAVTLVRVAVAIGLAAGALGIVCQGAIAGGTSVWSALDATVIGNVLETRFGTVWELREIAWVLLGLATIQLSPFTTTPRAKMASVRGAVILIATSFLVLAPALSGHASTFTPGWLLVPSTTVHVEAMSIWAGGVSALVFGLRFATRRLEPEDRTRLLSAALVGFSGLALGAVVALAATGTIQAVSYLESVSDLWSTGFGRAVSAKILLFGALVTVGVIQRRRSLPQLRKASEGGLPPGRGGKVAIRALRVEVALFASVLAATAILAGEPPPGAEAGGPQSASADLGAARLDVSVEPASVGSNEIHLYLFDAEDGSQYDELGQVSLEASVPAEEIGPIELDIEKSGPGHYTAPDAVLGVPGEWELELSGRVSRFEDLTGSVEIEIR